ncbi:hypothetical protein CDAR_40291 [Caerostris darwini]|uniref:Uncharacterized protein n=1 Tax=Caerostris darwini TaxID=1538125 RepID=A0AAV4R8B6_9ARAC|nr:hypothetical protein CDAR_40291 [Caerostris darwini]
METVVPMHEERDAFRVAALGHLGPSQHPPAKASPPLHNLKASRGRNSPKAKSYPPLPFLVKIDCIGGWGREGMEKSEGWGWGVGLRWIMALIVGAKLVVDGGWAGARLDAKLPGRIKHAS